MLNLAIGLGSLSDARGLLRMTKIGLEPNHLDTAERLTENRLGSRRVVENPISVRIMAEIQRKSRDRHERKSCHRCPVKSYHSHPSAEPMCTTLHLKEIKVNTRDCSERCDYLLSTTAVPAYCAPVLAMRRSTSAASLVSAAATSTG